MITVRDATPEERAIILRDTCAPAGEIPAARHLTPARVAELCGMPREEFLRGPVLAAPSDDPPIRRRSLLDASMSLGWPPEDPFPVDMPKLQVRIIEALHGEMTSLEIANVLLDIPMTIVWSALGDLVRSRAIRKIRVPEGNRFRLAVEP